LTELERRGQSTSKIIPVLGNWEAEGGSLSTRLIEGGVPLHVALECMAAVYELPVAPAEVLAQVAAIPDAGVDRDLLFRLEALPTLAPNGNLVVVFSDPVVARSATAMGFVPHQTALAAGPQIRAALSRLLGAPAQADTLGATGGGPEALAQPTIPMPGIGNAGSLPSFSDPSQMPTMQDANPAVVSGLAPTQKTPLPAPVLTLKTPPPSAVAQPLAAPSETLNIAALGQSSGGMGNVDAAAMKAQGNAQILDSRIEFSPGDQFGPYTIERMLGEGGMATVYLATDNKNGTPVALKVMLPHLAKNAEYVERFRREARAGLELSHPNVVRLIAFGEEQGQEYMAYEYVEGGTLQELLLKTGPLPAALAVKLMTGFLRGLRYAHEKGVVHRDLKPANLLVSNEGEVKVADFGIAKISGDATLTQTGMLVGTPAYMSPEQAFSFKPDHRSDLFSAGTIFYELLTGQNPFMAELPSAAMLKVSQGKRPEVFRICPWIPSVVEEAVNGLLVVDRELRVQNAEVVILALKDFESFIDERYPNLVARTLTESADILAYLKHDQANSEVARARGIAERTPDNKAAAALALYRAISLDPTHAAAREGLEKVCLQTGFSFAESADPRILEVENQLRAEPNNPGLRLRASELHRTSGNLHLAAVHMKVYLRARPRDQVVRQKLDAILGLDQGPAVFTSSTQSVPALGQQTQAILQGIKTGGLKASAPIGPANAAAAAAELNSIPGSPSLPEPSLAPSPEAFREAFTTTPEISEASRPTGAGEWASALWNAFGLKGTLVLGALLFVLLFVKGVGSFIDSGRDTMAESLETAQTNAKLQAMGVKFKAEENSQRRMLKEGKAMLEAGDPLGAKEAFDRGLSFGENTRTAVEMRFYRAQVLKKLGRKNEALTDLDWVLGATKAGEPLHDQARTLRHQIEPEG
jgi:serine/threonine protein kinase